MCRGVLGRRRASEASESESVAAQGAYKLPREGVNVRRGRRSDAEIKSFFWAPTLTSLYYRSRMTPVQGGSAAENRGIRGKSQLFIFLLKSQLFIFLLKS